MTSGTDSPLSSRSSRMQSAQYSPAISSRVQPPPRTASPARKEHVASGPAVIDFASLPPEPQLAPLHRVDGSFGIRHATHLPFPPLSFTTTNEALPNYTLRTLSIALSFDFAVSSAYLFMKNTRIVLAHFVALLEAPTQDWAAST